MPELPEVEVTRLGISPHVLNKRVLDVWHDALNLREPYPENLSCLRGHTVDEVGRRAKYLLFRTKAGILVIHLGMTGHLRMARKGQTRLPHDHFELILDDDTVMRLNDQRRFGLVTLFADPNLLSSDRHFAALGIEPFDPLFDAAYLYNAFQKRKINVKTALLGGSIVVGVGNIYCSEALFAAGISPLRPCNQISPTECDKLCSAVCAILRRAIAMGGTTIRDFQGADGKPGYFAQELRAYGRADQPCVICGTPLKQVTIAQRSTFYCPKCQK